MHKPKSVPENKMHKILWNFEMQTDHLIPARIPNLVMIKKRNFLVRDFAVPADHRLKIKENEKKDNYIDLTREVKKKQTMKHEGGGYTNCKWCAWKDPQRLVKDAGRVRNWRTCRDDPNYGIGQIVSILRRVLVA